MTKKFLTLVLIAAVLVPLGLYAGSEIRLESDLIAPATSGDVSGKVEFRHRLDRQRRTFSAEIEGFTPGDRYDVMISGVVVGTVTVDDFGVADLNYDDNFERGDDPATIFPPNFPALDGGERVEIGPLTGNLQSR